MNPLAAFAVNCKMTITRVFTSAPSYKIIYFYFHSPWSKFTILLAACEFMDGWTTLSTILAHASYAQE